MSLDSLFSPKSVQLIGSSRSRLEGNMVNPEIFSRLALNIAEFEGRSSIVDIAKGGVPGKADLTVLSLPPTRILDIVKDARLKTKFVIILPGNFSKFQRDRLMETAKRRRFRVLGPNSVAGVLSVPAGLNTTFEKKIDPKKGGMSFISQSGGVGAAFLDKALSRNAGIARIAWVGDMSDVDDAEIIDWLSKDRHTNVIGLYIEGLKDARSFMDAVKKCRKPVVVFKSGSSRAGATRASTHTASTSGIGDYYAAAFKQVGAHQVDGVNELFAACWMLARKCKTMGGVGVVSNTGGPAVIAADALESSGLSLTRFCKRTKDKIERKHMGVKAFNPVDTIADADGKRYADLLEDVLKDTRVGAVLSIVQMRSCLFRPHDFDDLKMVAESAKKPIVFCVPGGSDFDCAKVSLDGVVPVFSSINDAVSALRVLLKE